MLFVCLYSYASACLLFNFFSAYGACNFLHTTDDLVVSGSLWFGLRWFVVRRFLHSSVVIGKGRLDHESTPVYEKRVPEDSDTLLYQFVRIFIFTLFLWDCQYHCPHMPLQNLWLILFAKTPTDICFSDRLLVVRLNKLSSLRCSPSESSHTFDTDAKIARQILITLLARMELHHTQIVTAMLRLKMGFR